MLLPEEIISSLKNSFGPNFSPSKMKSVGGGSINQTAQFKFENKSYFIKWNLNETFPFMFMKEEKGLKLLKAKENLGVPKVLHHNTAGKYAYLLLAYLESGNRTNHFWEDFGRGLARLHQNTSDSFGLDHDNYIGSLPQKNEMRQTWSEFFIEMRLEPMIAKAYNSSLLNKTHTTAFHRFFQRIEEIFPEEPPALIHGDLWSGNYMVGPKGDPYIIDPAVYYGHREMDIGMSKLFGGFSAEFYHFYNEESPLQKGWESRVDLCNLYPLLVHVNLFGLGYVGQVENIIRRF